MANCTVQHVPEENVISGRKMEKTMDWKGNVCNLFHLCPFVAQAV